MPSSHLCTVVVLKWSQSEIMTAPHRKLIWLKKTIRDTDVRCWCCTLTFRVKRAEHNRSTEEHEDDLWNMLVSRSNMKSGVIIKICGWNLLDYSFYYTLKLNSILSSCLSWCWELKGWQAEEEGNWMIRSTFQKTLVFQQTRINSVNPLLRKGLARITAQPAAWVQSSMLVHCSVR